ncbi:MAG: DUF4239 domain-containing protein [Verrucomicrobiae bacterium]|jgi:FtsH-binding integral membrane protein|nr:DUF4239 domain-containing protein [Verrucomicrobiae bacterium]
MNVEHYVATLPGLFWICLIAPVFFALIGIYIARKLIEPHKRNPHHDIAHAIIAKLSKLYLLYPINSAKESIYFKQSIDNLTKLRKYRELRIEDSCTGLLPLLWILFLLAGTTLVLVSLLMISSPGKTHGAMVVLLAMLIGIMTFAIISLDFPFSGFTKLSTIPLENIPMDALR